MSQLFTTAKKRVRRIVSEWKDTMRPVRVLPTDDPSVQILQGVKLYRDIRVGDTVFRGSADAGGRSIDYVFSMLPEGALTGKDVLDLGAAGGAVCFEAMARGSRRAVGVEIDARRLRGARYIKRRQHFDRVQFVDEDFWTFLRGQQARFDVVFALNILQHLANPFPMLRRMAKAARAYVVIEAPDDVTVEHYAQYGSELLEVEGARRATGPEDFTRFLARCDFDLVNHRPSSADVHFFRGDESPRSVYVYARRDANNPKSREERWQDMAEYRAPRIAAFDAARADPFNVELTAGRPFDEILRTVLGDDWTRAQVNGLLVGPRASGKTHYYEAAGPGARPVYNPKIFKFPNERGQQGLRTHLNPAAGAGGKLAQVLVSTMDDEYAHCSAVELAEAIGGRRAVCLLLNVDFDEHFDRLYRRQMERPGEDVDFETSLRFDCRRLLQALKDRHCQYRILTIPSSSGSKA